jgi:spermidine synthase
MTQRTQVMEEALDVFRRFDNRGLPLATIGDRLWGRRYVHWQSFCRPAGALMKRMAALGLVRCQYMSSTKRTLWFATNKSVGRG